MFRHSLSRIICLVLLSSGSLVAQKPDYRNSLRFGADYMSLDAPDAMGYRVLGRYARHIGDDRLVLEGSLGYLKIPNRESIGNGYFVEGRPRMRLSSDVTVSFDFLRSPRHALRVGFGPSAWYRQDDSVKGANFEIAPDNTVILTKLERKPVNEVNFGYNAAAEFELAINYRYTTSLRFGLANLNGMISSMLGVNIGYRFW